MRTCAGERKKKGGRKEGEGDTHRTDEKGERVEDMVRRDLDRQFGDDVVRIGDRHDRDLYVCRRQSISFYLLGDVLSLARETKRSP